MKIFDTKETFKEEISAEAFASRYQTASVVSTESLGSFFAKLKDSFAVNFSFMVGGIGDITTKEVLENRYETLHALKSIKFIHFREETTSKPENFKGYFVDYLEDLTKTSAKISVEVIQTLETLKMTVASFVNEYSDDKMMSVYGETHYKKTAKITEDAYDDMSKYFPQSNQGTKALVRNVLKTERDIPALYEGIAQLDKIINKDLIDRVLKLSKEASDLVDALVLANGKNNMLLSADESKAKLVHALQTAAKQVELISYLFGNAVNFAGCFVNLAELVRQKSVQ